MNLRESLLLSPINNLNPEQFKKNFKGLLPGDREFFFKKILYDKYAPIFLKYIINHKLQYLFNEEEITNLKNQSKRFQIQSLEIVKEIIYVDKIFKKNNLNPIYLKGASIMSEYPDISLRPVADIDILFNIDEVFDAYKILHEYDYRESSSIYHSRDKLVVDAKKKHHLPELCRNTNIMIELHHRVTTIYDFKNCPLSEKIIRNKRQISFYGRVINVPSIEYLITHQLIHFSINSKFNHLLRVFSDISEIEKKYEIDWNKIYSINKDKKIRRGISLGLEVLNFHFKLTNNFYELKNRYKDFFPSEDIILEAKKKTFRLKKKTSMHESYFYNLGKESGFIDFFKIILSKTFLSKDQIIAHYRILRPNYLNLFYFQTLSTFSRFKNNIVVILSLFFKRGFMFEEFKRVEKIEKWLN
tara:strand:- start:3635 stop:4876 length:1242 start_codon:yes stop_codon:yes gene_type:complete